MKQIERLEIHISHACNYSCQSCSHFSQFHISGNLPLQDAEESYKKWTSRIEPKTFVILGGEPTLNSDLTEHVKLAAKYWTKSRILIITNGSLLYRHTELGQVLSKISNHCLQISKHFDSEIYNSKFEKIIELCVFWKTKFNINFIISDSFSKWSRRYIEDGNNIHPFTDNNPRKSWENCQCRKCIELHEGKIWKCPIIAYLPQVQKRLVLGDEWDPYLAYEPLKPNCTDEELNIFFNKQEETVCGMCPAFVRPFIKSDPT